ncbi:hypothetical protein FSP39_020079 [Pinctada imbricata]|uniref:Uncharacterized protein n=1 Tax=Pinctada imbricata TaxID=66713 RepID=A0AA88Y189_PINIB|nr:hypothetical protein FSP39_020079 [Pinctada imbricata]
MADNIWSLSSSFSNSLQRNKNDIRTGRGRITNTKRAGSRMLDNTWSLSTSFSNPLQTSNNNLRAGRGSVTETKGVGSRSLNNMGSFSGSLSNPMQKNNNDLRTGGGRITETKSTGSRMLDNTWTLSSSFSNPLQTSNNDLRAGRGRISETKRVGSKIVDNTISAPSKSESRVIWRSQSASSSSDTQGQLSFSNPNIKHKQTAGVRREGDTIHLSSESKSQVLWQPNAVSPLLDIKTKQYFVDYKYPVVRPTEKTRDNKLSLLSGVPRHVKTSDFGISFSDNVMSGSLSQIHPKARRRSVPNTALGQQVDRTHNSATVSHPTLSGHVSHRTSLSRHIRSTSTQSSFKTETSNLSQNYVLDAQELCRGKEIFACFGKGRHSKLPGMKWWCVQNCRHGNCPLSKCRCGCQISGSKNLRNIQLLLVQKQIEKNVFPVTTIPSSTRRTVWNCKPTSAYTPVKGLSEWCNRMCSLNACPLNMCDCS